MDTSFLEGFIAIQDGSFWFFKGRDEKNYKLKLHLERADADDLKVYGHMRHYGKFAKLDKPYDDATVPIRFNFTDGKNIIFFAEEDGFLHSYLQAFEAPVEKEGGFSSVSKTFIG
jgi:hypothetical protein